MCSATTRKLKNSFQNLAWVSSGLYSRWPKWVKAHVKITLDAKWKISFQIFCVGHLQTLVSLAKMAKSRRKNELGSKSDAQMDLIIFLRENQFASAAVHAYASALRRLQSPRICIRNGPRIFRILKLFNL